MPIFKKVGFKMILKNVNKVAHAILNIMGDFCTVFGQLQQILIFLMYYLIFVPAEQTGIFRSL